MEWRGEILQRNQQGKGHYIPELMFFDLNLRCTGRNKLDCGPETTLGRQFKIGSDAGIRIKKPAFPRGDAGFWSYE
jgi:hypothetical protein